MQTNNVVLALCRFPFTLISYNLSTTRNAPNKQTHQMRGTIKDFWIRNPDPELDCHQNLIDWSLDHVHPSKKFKQNPFITSGEISS